MVRKTTKIKPNKEWLWVSVFSLTGLVLLAIWANARGAFGIARNDDWVYLHMAQWLNSTGVFIVESSSLTNASGLVYLVQPLIWVFGFNVGILQFFVGLIGVLGLLCSWIVLRTFLPRFEAVISLLALVLSPFWATLSFSFMTDVPAYTFQMLALVFLICSNQTKVFSFLWFGAALATSLFAFTIREYAIVAGLAIVVTGLYWSRTCGRKQLFLVIFQSTVWFIAAVTLYLWRSNLNNATVSPPALSRSDVYGAVVQFGQLMLVLGIFIWPALASINWIRLFKKTSGWRSYLMGTLFLMSLSFFTFLHIRVSLSLGNTFTLLGSYPGTLPLGTYPEVFPAGLFFAIQIIGAIGFSLFVVLIVALVTQKNLIQKGFSRYTTVEKDYSSELIVGIYLFGTLACLGAVALITTAPLIDRYVFGLIPFVVGLVFSLGQKMSVTLPKNKLIASFTMGLLSLVGLVYVDTSLVVDGAKWTLGKTVTSLGIPSHSIDAGYEWFGFHQDQLAEGKYIQPIPNWWTSLYANPSVCALGGIGNPGEIGVDPAKVIASFKTQNLIGTEYFLWAVESDERCKL